MKRWRLIARVVLIAMVSNNFANANDNDHQSAKSVLPACRSFIKTPADEKFMQGYCAGLIEGLSFLSRGLPPGEFRSCIPNGVTISQMTTVVVRWLEQRPQRWNESFKGLALSAFHDEWPCQ
jgi:Ssp1 endopeptidase immunity protein Rap1a